MVLRKYNTRTSYRYILGAVTKPITLLKRDDDQRQGVVRAVRIWYCRRGEITKTGQTLQGDMVTEHKTTWHIPQVELVRAGVQYLNALDRIVEYVDDGNVPINPPRTWQPESTTLIEVKLFENWVSIECLRVDPTPPGG